MPLLDIRNTPSQDTGTSPTQRMLNRRARTLIPMTKSLLRSHCWDSTDTNKTLVKSQQRQAKYYNRSAHDLTPLDDDDIVCLKLFTNNNKTERRGRKQW